MKLRKIKLILLSICNLITVTLSAQSITNVQSHQEGNNIVVTYTLQSSAPVDIVLSLSKDGGATFTEPLKSVTGDIGEDISQETGALHGMYCKTKLIWRAIMLFLK